MPPVPPDLPLLTTVVLTLLAATLVVAEPVVGRRHFREFLDDVRQQGEPARVRHLTRWSLTGWAWAVAVLAVVTVLPGVDAADLGLRSPDLDPLLALRGGGGVGEGALAGLLTGVVVGVLVVAVSGLVMARRGRRLPMPGNDAVQAMLPTSARGRCAWAGLSVTAGITEEITYRGLLVLVITTLAPDLPVAVVVAVLAVLFGVAHWYQGRAGMLATGLAGAGLAGLYLATGSLVVPMVVHIVMDLRALLLASPACDLPQPATPAEHLREVRTTPVGPEGPPLGRAASATSSTP